MPTTQRLPPLTGTTATEPVSQEELRAWVVLDADDPRTPVLYSLGIAAREKVENYTERFFAGGQHLATTFDLSEAYALPYGAAPLTVSGFFTDFATLTAWNLEEYRKGISTNRQLYLGEALNQSYTVTYTLPAETYCPELAKAAIKELAAEWFRNRESTTVGTIAPELSVGWRVKLAELRKTVLL